MSRVRLAWSVHRFRVALGLVAAGLICAGVAQAGTTARKVQASVNPGQPYNQLWSVAATSATNAWAVGDYVTTSGAADRTLIEHWNGKAWKVQPSPNPSGFDHNSLYGVAATSATNAWAVGYAANFAGGPVHTLIEHWNGKAWKAQPSPNPGGSTANDQLFAVAATSATNAWAVGYAFIGPTIKTVIEHWNGKAWKAQPSPNPGGSSPRSMLLGVAATSATNAWAVGRDQKAPTAKTLIEHWNGKTWKVQSSVNPGNYDNEFWAATATSSTNAWAVYYTGTTQTTDKTLIEHWNGKTWKVHPSPNPGASTANDVLYGVAATSSTNAWAVGRVQTPPTAKTLIEHWNGKAWKVAPSPSLGQRDVLQAVAATSTTNAWAVGHHYSGPTQKTLIEHWNGKAWKVQPSVSPSH